MTVGPTMLTLAGNWWNREGAPSIRAMIQETSGRFIFSRWLMESFMPHEARQHRLAVIYGVCKSDTAMHTTRQASRGTRCQDTEYGMPDPEARYKTCLQDSRSGDEVRST